MIRRLPPKNKSADESETLPRLLWLGAPRQHYQSVTRWADGVVVLLFFFVN